MTGITTIDCQYLYPRFAAAFLMKEGAQAAFIENNTAHSVPILLKELERQGIAREQVKYLIVTHVHLDHAGGSSALMQACPNAVLLAHPRAAPHLIDPSKLVASARQVYGDQAFEKMYGTIQAIPSERVRAMEDGDVLHFGNRTLKFIHTRGHANHHFCVHDSGSNGVFTGDAFGLAYPAIQNQGLFLFPSTSPTDFDPAEARKSIDRILATGASRAYLTHFGEVIDLREGARQLNEYLDFIEPDYLSDADLSEPRLEEKIREFLRQALVRRGVPWTPEVAELLKLDIELNAAGVVFAARKRRRKNPAPSSSS